MSEKLSELNTILESSNQIERTNKRIQELKDKERELANQIAELEGQEFMTEEFIRTKVDLLESRINSRFEFVKFKMFNAQVNGALEETCEALIDGVPFSNANNASKINAGIDIINTLNEYYGVSAPIVIDNAEAVNNIINSNSQMIKLSVSLDKSLRVKIEKEITKEDIKEVNEILKDIKSRFSDHDTTAEEYVPEEFESLGYEDGEHHRWWYARYEYYKYKGIKICFSCQMPATEMQEGQDTCPEIYIDDERLGA